MPFQSKTRSLLPLQILNQVESKCANNSRDENRPAALSDGLPQTLLQKEPDETLHDLVLYVSDIMHTLRSFCVDVYPVAAEAFFEVG